MKKYKNPRIFLPHFLQFIICTIGYIETGSLLLVLSLYFILMNYDDERIKYFYGY